MENPSERELQNGILFDPEKLGLGTIGLEQEQSNDSVPSLDTARREDDKLEPIAVIGFAARLPQDASTPENFWQMLCEGRCARTEIPQDRFNVDAFYHPDPDRIDATNVRTGNFLAGNVSAFDAPFFSIQPTEVASMDPQQRIMLETSYQALENAGLPMDSIIGSKTCVYVGSSARDYEALLLRDPESPAKYLGTGIGTSLLANRISWFYDLRGPSIALDTACSSSLSALHLACQSLRNHESILGLAGGCNLILAPDVSMVHLSNMGFFSPDGRCFTFDQRANGYAKGEGAGVVVIKLLKNAIEDGDTIRAVIRATGTNQDGKTPGLTQPSKAAQEQNILDTYYAGGLDLDTTKYFEAHGTGTQIGDPIEAEAISAAFKKRKDDPIYVGAVKPNIGHLESASGVASLIKAVLALEKGLIPPNINFECPNVSIPLDEWHIKFPLETTPWPTSGLRRVSVNSFGYGGSNAHCVLDDAFNYLKRRGLKGKHWTTPTPPPSEHEETNQGLVLGKPVSNDLIPNDHTAHAPTKIPKIFVWSAADEEGVRRLAGMYEQHLSAKPLSVEECADVYLGDLAYTLSDKRSSLPWKSYVVANSPESLREKLATCVAKPIRSSAAPTLSFIFTGQGAQWAGMGHGLVAYPVFEESLRRSEDSLKILGCSWSLMDKFQKGAKDSEVNSPAVAQPMCTALQVALVDLLSSWDIHPTAIAGHSSGEIAAAYCAGSLSQDSAIKVAFYRGSLAARLAKGSVNRRAMASVAMSEDAITPYLKVVTTRLGGGRLTIGCVNSPINVTATGDLSCVDALIDLMSERGVFARKLQINVAYHSAYMEEIADAYSEHIRDIVPRSFSPASHFARNKTAIFSSVTGTLLPGDSLSRSKYWLTNLVSKVRFSDALTKMSSYLLNQRAKRSSGKDLLIEIGPTAALQRPIKDIIDQVAKSNEINYDSVLRRGVSGLESCLEFIGRLRCSAHQVNLAPINSPTTKRSDLRLLVNLPQYPFNHQQTYWTESRISRNFRTRKHARHELLGTPSADWNPAEPKWRNVIRITESPWIVDHKLGGTELYPAGGMMVMAIEAMRQLADPSRAISGYILRDVVFPRALLVSDSPEGVETQLLLRRRKNSTKPSVESGGFTIYALSNDEWSLVCEGAVTLEYADQSVRNSSNRGLDDDKIRAKFDAGVKSCKETIHSTQFYKNLANLGFHFGPTFQPLEQIRYNCEGEAVATVKLDGWKSKIISGEIKDHVIHPTAMDGLFQLGMAAISKGSWDAIPTMVPTQLKCLWISNNLLKRSDKSEIKIHTKPTFRGFREAEFQIVALNSRNEVQITADGWRETALNSLEASSAENSGLNCYHIDWKPDPDMMESAEIAALCDAATSHTVDPMGAMAHQLKVASAFFIVSALKTVPHVCGARVPHLQRYVEWMQHQSACSELETYLEKDPIGKRVLDEESYREIFMREVSAKTPEGEIFVKVGRNLSKILRADTDLSEFYSCEEFEQKLYSSPDVASSYAKVGTYLDLLAHKNLGLKILEVGAGIGFGTQKILESLYSSVCTDDTGATTLRCHKYDFTDTSAAVLKNAEERFKEHASQMSFAVLDVEKDPLEQGFEAQQYDLVVCSLVFYTVADVGTTLQNIRTLLKRGGRLIVLEPVNPDSLRASFVSCLLPKWWRAIDGKRKLCPLLSSTDWHEALLANGFSGAEIRLPDSTDVERHTFSVIISTALEKEMPTMDKPRTMILVEGTCSKQIEVAARIQESLRSTDCPSEVLKLQDIKLGDLSNTICIFMLELETPFLAGMSEDDFIALKAMIKSAAGILWVTQGCGERPLRPELGLVTGFGRNVTSESWGIRFIELALELGSSDAQIVDRILTVYQKSLVTQEEDGESEYMEKDGRLCISRAREAQYLNESVGTKTIRQLPRMKTFGSDANRSLQLTIASPGLLDTFRFEDDPKFHTQLGSDEMELKVRATGVNFKDMMIALGQLAGSTLGYECAGIVTRVGSSVEYKPGDRVLCCTNTGAFSTYARAHVSSVAKIPTHMSFCAAAALPTAFCTAYYALSTLAHLQEGESVLIHSGAGGVGQAAIQLAKILKANVFTTVGTEEKKRFLTDIYGISPDHIFSSRGASFSGPLKGMTDGVDVVLNSLSGEGLHESWSCIRPFGRFIELGKADINSGAGLSMSPFAKNVTFCSVDLGLVMDMAKPVMAATLKAVMALMTEQAASLSGPRPLHVYNVSEVENAFRFMQSGKHMGKIVVEMYDDAVVPVMPSSRPTYLFDERASYVIAGGLGGLGRSITRWMVDRSARNFILLSRSGAKSNEAVDLIEEMTSRGVRIVAPPCDVSDEAAVSTTLEECKRILPPIKGCIQASMVLKDGLFENLSHSDFYAATKPKVQGSWNLHKHLPSNLDFFVLLSSVAGVTGTRGQSNYAAGNSYQDALARHRVSRGEKCISLNLGAILSIGVAAEKDLSESLERDGFVGLPKASLFALLDHCCDPSTPLLTPWSSQILTGLGALEQGRQVYWTQKPLFSILRPKHSTLETSVSNAANTDNTTVMDHAALLESATSQAAAEDVVLQALKFKLASSLMIPLEDIDEQKPIFAFGIDSLVALEVRYWFQKTLRAQVSVLDIMQAKSLLGLAAVAAGGSELWGKR